jgi:hypothetical protein
MEPAIVEDEDRHVAIGTGESFQRKMASSCRDSSLGAATIISNTVVRCKSLSFTIVLAEPKLKRILLHHFACRTVVHEAMVLVYVYKGSMRPAMEATDFVSSFSVTLSL